MADTFWRTAGCIAPTAPLMKNQVWMKDRFGGSGGGFTQRSLTDNRAWSISQLRLYYGIVENVLADGRKWILAGHQPSLAEIHAAWVYDWGVNMASNMADASDPSTADMKRALTGEEFPKLYEWVKRFRTVADEAGKSNAAGGGIDEGTQAEDDVVKRILGASFTESEPVFDDNDVLGLKKGQCVSVAPVDFGFTHKDGGKLVGLSKNEVVIDVEAPEGKDTLRLHYPRINFKILPVA